MSGPVLALGPDGVAKIIKPEIVVEAERQKDLAKQRMHRQVALEMYCAEVAGDTRGVEVTINQRKTALDCCVELAGYLIEKTGGHQ